MVERIKYCKPNSTHDIGLVKWTSGSYITYDVEICTYTDIISKKQDLTLKEAKKLFIESIIKYSTNKLTFKEAEKIYTDSDMKYTKI